MNVEHGNTTAMEKYKIHLNVNPLATTQSNVLLSKGSGVNPNYVL